MYTAILDTSTMSQFRDGEVPWYLSSDITVLPALPEVMVPSFPQYSASYIERGLCRSSITPLNTFLPASSGLQSTYMSASNFTSDLCINNGLPNEKLSSGSHIIAISGFDTSLSSTHSSYKDDPSSLRMLYPKVSEEIYWVQEPVPGVFDYPASLNVSDQRNLVVSQEMQDIITLDHDTHLAKQKEWFSSESSGKFLENSGCGGSVLKAVDTRSTAPPNYTYFHMQNNVSSHFNVDELCSDNFPSSDTAPTKSRMRWTTELHELFVGAIIKLGGSEKATPKAVQKIMKVEGLTIYHVKSHLQKYRTVRHRSESSDAGTSTERSGQMDEISSQKLKDMDTSEGLRTQIGLQKQLHEQLEIQRKLQLQVEEHSKYLEMAIAKQGESLKQLGALPVFENSRTQVLDHIKACEDQTVDFSGREALRN
ncbi:protein PHOSPHATE STARVATION RESPONSE 2 isoform X1 [Brachypodium distachyon]|uniref:protein PHOSPHATE STARVATION RESPONSE 2 isoform X1 n=1 Tax=Brachypodium distachyon TaxID=15368 RepID=UPI00071DE258|nr:protein PHOSPHATE STARVATION RESPONSE 2 isoform X1 [Brachypodium distachyon]|eukprot:XP_010235956.2 protein PHOSPHATE STARVATION RESPONSE 2 isoform X1 [Brachypodium distachyon]